MHTERRWLVGIWWWGFGLGWWSFQDRPVVIQDEQLSFGFGGSGKRVGEVVGIGGGWVEYVLSSGLVQMK